MSHLDLHTIGAISSLLKFDPTEYYAKLNDDTQTLVSSAHEIVWKHEEALQNADDYCWLDRLLTGLLSDAPTPEGQQHVAIVLCLVDESYGAEGVINVAKVWFEKMMIPLRGQFGDCLEVRCENVDWRVDEDGVGPGTAPQRAMFKQQLSKREEYRCAITHVYDLDRIWAIKGHEIEGSEADLPPDYDYMPTCLKAVCIIPYVRDDSHSALVGTSCESLAVFRNRKDVILTWNLLKAWAASINIPYLAGDGIYCPENGILMSSAMRADFQSYQIYFDKHAYPHSRMRYKVRHVLPWMTLPNGEFTMDAQFGKSDTGIAPPNPLYLQVHTSLCKATNFHGPILKERFRRLHDLDD